MQPVHILEAKFPKELQPLINDFLRKNPKWMLRDTYFNLLIHNDEMFCQNIAVMQKKP